MATGDVKGSLRKLQASLRSIKYPRDVDYQGLSKGDPSCCLPIMSYTFTSFSTAVAEHLVELGIELTGKNDLSFMESVYKVLRDLFSYKPLLTKQQFLQSGFAERKISLICDIIGFVLEKHKQLTKGTKPVGQMRRRQLSRSDSKSVESSPPRETQRTPGPKLVKSRSLVERHSGHQTPAHVSFSSDDQLEDQDEDGRRRPQDLDLPRPVAQTECVLESRLRTVEAGLQECVSRLEQQLSMLDVRVQALEKDTAGKICVERSVWEELENRVLLLETGLTLTRAQDPMRTSVEMRQHPDETVKEPVSCPSVTHQTSPAHQLSSSSEENIKERLERIASMMKDTSSLLKNIEPTI